jgi:hypothetical protein
MASKERPPTVPTFCRLCLLLVCVVAAWAIASSTEAFNTTAGAILSAPERYDNNVVTLGGSVTNLQQRVSQRGNPYYTFDLRDATGRIRIFSFGQAPCPEGHQAIVEGIYERVKRMEEYTFYDEVAASRVMCR